MIVEREEVIGYVLSQLREKGIDLTESERFLLINKAHAAAKRGMMEETITWELTLLLERGNDGNGPVYLTRGRYIPFRNALEGYLRTMRLLLFYSNNREAYFVRLPKGIARGEFLRRIKRIMKTGSIV